MSEGIWLAELSAEQLAGWLTPPRAGAPFAILERVDALDFPPSEASIEPTAWERGRVFGPAFELRWERDGAAYRTRLTGERDPGPPFRPWPWPTPTAPVESGCFLWGKDEMRIGRRLVYGALLPGSGRPYLLRREFRRQADGALIAERYSGMEWKEAE